MIIGQNSLLNQYSPTFYIKNLTDGQGLLYDATRKAFVNAHITGGSGGVNKLGELLNVSPTVDSPNPSLHNGQALVFNAFTSLWENSFTDYNTLLNKPTSSSFSFAGLSDTAKPSLADGYVKWNSTGTQLVYSTTIPAASITGLATVAITGNYNDLTNKPSSLGSVTTVSVVSANGVSGVVANPTSTPAITLTLGAITPTSVTSTGIVTGSNLSGTNTGDQTIALIGDVTGSGPGTFPTTLATVNTTTGSFGSATTVPQFIVDGKGRITNVVNVPIVSGGVGTVTSVSGAGTVSGLTLSGTVTSSGAITLGGSLVLTSGQITTALGFTPGTVTSVGVSGTTDITVTGSTITSSGSFAISLANTTVTPNTYGSSTFVPVITVDSKGRITNVTNTAISGGNGTVTSVTVNGTTGRINSSGSPITSSGAITLDLAAVPVVPSTYGSASSVPVFSVDAYGRVTGVTNTPITSGASNPAEIVVFHYTPGGAGNFNAGDVIYSSTAGVTATITDAANCIATYSFTGKTNPPKSVTMYGQNYTTNKFSVTSWPATAAPAANYTIAGGGTSLLPDLVAGLFSPANIITMQTRMSDTGAASTIGNRAWLVIVFGF